MSIAFFVYPQGLLQYSKLTSPANSAAGGSGHLLAGEQRAKKYNCAGFCFNCCDICVFSDLKTWFFERGQRRLTLPEKHCHRSQETEEG